MFLALTADKKYRETEENVIFLGEWCRIFSGKGESESRFPRILPYHWNSRKKIWEDYLYLDRLYESVLTQTADMLNKTHREEKSLRYWRIIIGPWLSYFIPLLYDRYQSVITALKSGNADSILVPRYSSRRWVPNDFPVFLKWFINDEYNNYLYSEIIGYIGSGIAIEYTDEEEEGQEQNIHVSGQSILAKRLFRNIVNFLGNLLPAKMRKIVFFTTSLEMSDALRFQLALRQFLYFVTPEVYIPLPEIDEELRRKLLFELPEGEFERVLNYFICRQMPSLYLENYSMMKEKALGAYPVSPKVIMTDNAFFSDEGFKFWAAYNTEGGTKLLGTQHGGLYGAGMWYGDEDHETAICDRYYSWGWESDKHKNIKPMPPMKLIKLTKKKSDVRPGDDGRILMVLANFPRYYYHMYSIPYSATGVLRYFQQQYDLCRQLPHDIRKLMLIRLFVHDYDWHQRDRWAVECPDIECYKGNKSIIDQLKECRLCVVTYNATTVLETFTLNFPTILYWDAEQWEIRPSARPYYERLHQAGILHYTPESAAAKINEIHKDTAAWWGQEGVQKAKDDFCHQFARYSRNCIEEWKYEILGYEQ